MSAADDKQRPPIEQAASAKMSLRRGQTQGIPSSSLHQRESQWNPSVERHHSNDTKARLKHQPTAIRRLVSADIQAGTPGLASAPPSDQLRQQLQKNDPRGHLQDILGLHAPPDETQGECVWKYRARQRIKWVLSAGNAKLCGTRMTPQEPLRTLSPTRRQLPATSKGRGGRSRSAEPSQDSDTLCDDARLRGSSSTLLRSSVRTITKALTVLSSMSLREPAAPAPPPLLCGNRTLLPIPERSQSAGSALAPPGVEPELPKAGAEPEQSPSDVPRHAHHSPGSGAFDVGSGAASGEDSPELDSFDRQMEHAAPSPLRASTNPGKP